MTTTYCDLITLFICLLANGLLIMFDKFFIFFGVSFCFVMFFLIVNVFTYIRYATFGYRKCRT